MGLFLTATSAQAATSAPHWALEATPSPTNFATADTPECLSGSNVCDTYVITATNVGAEATAAGSEVVLKDTVPPGLTVKNVGFFWKGLPAEFGGQEANLAGLCTTTPVRCALPGSFFSAAGHTVRPDDTLRMYVHTTVDEATPAGQALLDTAALEGGGAPPAVAEVENQVSSATPPFDVQPFDNLFAALDGTPPTQAGARPYELTTTVGLNSAVGENPEGSVHQVSAVEDPRDILVDLPPGLIGSARAASECTLNQLSSKAHCPPESQVGFLETEPPGTLTGVASPVWNLVPEHGVAAEFGYVDALRSSHILYASVAPTPAGYVIRTTAPEIPQIPLTKITTNIYGDPAARAASRPEEAKDLPLFTSPAECSGQPLLSHIYTDSWQHPGARDGEGNPVLSDPDWVAQTSAEPPVSGCNQLQFHPTLEAAPETNRADSPTGLDVTLKVPQPEGAKTLATPPLKRAVVSLPEGMTVNPSSANGRLGCSLAELGMSPSGEPNAEAPHCPDAAKLGTVELETPALKGILEGQIYVARQSENPFKSLLALYIVVNDPTTGVIVKIPGEVKADPATGQLTTIVDNSPQFPFSELRTHFFGGQKAALRTPAVCGKYTVTSQLTPYSAPESGPPATPSATFKITQSANGAPCPKAAGEEVNKPAFSAGTLDPTAGAFSPFALKLSREDGSQELKGLNLTLPPGLSGKLAGLTECSEAQLATVSARSGLGQGAAELSSPSCPASSEVGTVTVGAGAGLTPYYAQGKAYLAGPYKGAPLSLAVITPAVAGPFDLGDVLVRNALYVNLETAQITAKSDPLPTILAGIPLDIRSVVLNMNKPNFTLNPTSCEKKEVKGEALSVLGQSAPLTNPFQVGGCKALGFKPKLKIDLKGGTKRSKHPALTATLTYPKGNYANIAKASVALPHSEFLEQAHIKTICTRVQFAEGAVPGEKCPPGSIYGKARAITPLLDKPLEGPVYLRSSSNKLPDLVAALNGQIQVVLDGTIDSVHGGIRNRFEVVPDAPVSKFTLSMQGGKKGLLVNSTNLCKSTNKAVAKFTAQNGKTFDTEPVVTNSCKKSGKGKGKGKGHKHKGAHK